MTRKFTVAVRLDATEIDTVRVLALTHRGAVDAVRKMDRHWPRGCTFTPRLVDERSYSCNFLDSDFGPLSHSGSLA